MLLACWLPRTSISSGKIWSVWSWTLRYFLFIRSAKALCYSILKTVWTLLSDKYKQAELVRSLRRRLKTKRLCCIELPLLCNTAKSCHWAVVLGLWSCVVKHICVCGNMPTSLSHCWQWCCRVASLNFSRWMTSATFVTRWKLTANWSVTPSTISSDSSMRHTAVHGLLRWTGFFTGWSDVTPSDWR